MISKMALVRKRFIVSGNVQDVGYRALIKRKARRLGILGFSKNLPDETVEIVCEGTPDALAGFIKSIEVKGDPEDSFSLHVTTINETPPPEGKLTVFYTDYGRKLTEVERQTFDRDEIMVLRAGTLNSNVGVVGQKVEGVGKAVEGVGKDVREVGQKVEGVGKAVEGVGQKVDAMHSDMNKRFDHMAQRYDLIATSLVKAIDRIDRGFDRMDQNSKKTDKAIEQSRKEVAASNRELAGAVKFMIRKLSGRSATARQGNRKKRK